MLKHYFHNRERHLAMLNDDRVAHEFGWGTEFIDANANGTDPRKFFREHAKWAVENSEEFFAYGSEPGAVATGFLRRKDPVTTAFGSDVITWMSGVATTSPENNIAHATYFPNGKERKSAVIILPHWNAKAGTYFDLAKIFNKLNISALRLTLPYHEERMPPELNRADYLVAPNVGRTLQSLQQAVVDTRACVEFLKQEGYEKVGIVGTSIGSCVAFFAFVHDMRIDAAVFNHVSGYPADVIWHGITTYKVREGLGDNLTLDELREYWLPISPMAYIEKLANLLPRPQRYIYTKYDLSFPVDLSLETMNELRKHNIEHSEVALPCGHYTLGEKPWVYLDGWKIISFLRKSLRDAQARR